MSTILLRHINILFQNSIQFFLCVFYLSLLYLIKFIILHPGPEWFNFHNLKREFIDDVILVISLYYFINVFYNIARKFA